MTLSILFFALAALTGVIAYVGFMFSKSVESRNYADNFASYLSLTERHSLARRYPIRLRLFAICLAFISIGSALAAIFLGVEYFLSIPASASVMTGS